MYYDGSCHDSGNTDWIGERWVGEWGRAIRTRAWNDVAAVPGLASLPGPR
jgi:hypothetical protein